MSGVASLRAAALCAVALAAGVCPLVARADEPRDGAAAEALFAEARKLQDAGDAAGACAKFDESYRLDPAPGTLLNLAACSLADGRTATAWGQFVEAERLFRRKGDERRAAFAKEKGAELEARLPRAAIRVLVPLEGLTVQRDGVSLGEASIGSALPIDPGEHVLTAEAPGYERAEVRFTAVEGKTVEVEIPALVLAPPEEKPGAAGGSGLGTTLRTTGFVVGAVGVASLVAGGVFVGLTASSESAAEPDCPGQVCNPRGADQIESARTFADVATITIIAGGVLAAGGLGLVLFAPDDATPETVALTPWLGPAVLGASVGGAF